ncbi:MAG: ribulose-phosphate 3-epimerase [Spirochaetales bacterium]
MIKISASTDPAGSRLTEYIKELDALNIDMFHCDIMDGNFVEAKTFDYEKVAEINNMTTTVLDVHLMIEEPQKVVKSYIKAGANIITVHYESFDSIKSLLKVVKYIKKRGVMAGLSFKPSTNLEYIKPLLNQFDLILVMSVEPGKSGQTFMEESLGRIKELSEYIKKENLHCLIEVDGGINNNNAKLVSDAGADILVVGSYLYHSENKKTALELLKKN